jgi:S-DNA-T family DNA segregation ATPase FtsK/SpoIIIE
VRVGLTPLELCCPIVFQEDYKGGYEPALLQQVRELVNRYSHLDAQPLVVPLAGLGTISVTGPHQATCGLVRSILAQVVTFHAPSEVCILSYFPPQAAREWRWLKWLPHTRRLRPVPVAQAGDPEIYSLLAETITDFQMLLETQIGPELEQRQKIREGKGVGEQVHQRQIPHLILVLDQFTRAGELAQLAGLEDQRRAGGCIPSGNHH